MFRKVLLFRNLTDNIPKNIGLYSVGVMLLFLFRLPIDLFQILLGLAAFLVSYSSIYVLNDFYDTEDDKTDIEKVLRKPLAQGAVKRSEALKIFTFFLMTGILLSVLLNLLFLCVVCLLILTNSIYSIPFTRNRKQNLDDTGLVSLKQSILGFPLVFLMQLQKIFLPWTISVEVLQFPVLFAVGFSLIYIVIFRGYKKGWTIGESIKHTLFPFVVAIIVFILSISVYPEPIAQASILLYILAGVAFFRNSYLTDRRVLLQSPVYIFLGIVILFYVISNL